MPSAPIDPALSHPQWLARAEAICKRRNTAIDAVRLTGISAEDVVRFASQSVALEQTAFTELRRLKPPASMARDWHKVLAYDRTLLDEIIKLRETGKRGDAHIIAPLSQSVRAVKRKLLTTATRDGLKYCARLR